ncbi:MAG: insulinase family protein [Gemmatimonadetes bacterium]|nr:insulinase family protein [Gemmatimonadota bacterium]MBK6454745.1 insulinase family protein [Gemmatimonadota bacterium]
MLLPIVAPAAQAGSAFAGVEARTLPNGLKVWMKAFAGEATAEVTLIVAGGSSLDPVGREELAHFVEHLVFGDRPGLTERGLNAQVESLGGKISANTSADRTMFRVTIPAEHLPAAIAWMAQLVAPRPITQALLDQQRTPILLELGATPRRAVDWVRALYLDPPALRRASSWKREFGLTTVGDREYYPHRSLHRITPADVQGFMERYYTPSNMTLVVAGGVPDDGTWRAVDEHFGALAARSAPPLPSGVVRTDGGDVTIWATLREARYMRLLRGASLTPGDRVLVMFLRELLDKRLNDRLRYGDDKLVYHPSVSLAMLSDASVITVYAAAEGAKLDAVRTLIDAEIAQLRDGKGGDSAFVADRDAIAQRARSGATGARAVSDAAASFFFATGEGGTMPDMVALYERVTPAMVAELLRERFPARGDNVRLFRPLPLSPVVLAGLAAVLVWGGVTLLRRVLTRPVEMRRLRYVARFRIDLTIVVPLLLLVGGIAAVVARLLAAAARPFLEAVVFPLPGAILQWGLYATILAAAIMTLGAIGARIPRKILVFEDQVRVKYLSYRSAVFPAIDIVECRRASFADIWLGRRLWRCLPLTLGIGTPGLYVRRRDGRALYCRVRDTEELAAAIESVRTRSA